MKTQLRKDLEAWATVDPSLPVLVGLILGLVCAAVLCSCGPVDPEPDHVHAPYVAPELGPDCRIGPFGTPICDLVRPDAGEDVDAGPGRQ